MTHFHGFPAVICQTEIGMADRLTIFNPSIYIFEGFCANLKGVHFFRGKCNGKIPLVLINLRTQTVELHWTEEYSLFNGPMLDWKVLGKEFENAQ